MHIDIRVVYRLSVSQWIPSERIRLHGVGWTLFFFVSFVYPTYTESILTYFRYKITKFLYNIRKFVHCRKFRSFMPKIRKKYFLGYCVSCTISDCNPKKKYYFDRNIFVFICYCWWRWCVMLKWERKRNKLIE